MKHEKRRRFTVEEKAKILKQHLLEKKALSDLCDENNMHPTMFYRWQNKVDPMSRLIFWIFKLHTLQ